MSISMEDYEIRDVMGRNQYPDVDLHFVLNSENYLEISARNHGEIYAQYVNCLIYVPLILLSEDEIFWSTPQKTILNDIEYFQILADNKATRRQAPISMTGYTIPAKDIPIPGLYEPILPYISLRLNRLRLRDDLENLEIENLTIDWRVHADNAPPNTGSILVSEIFQNRRD